MSAHDSNGYFVELGEYSLILAKANLGQRPRAVEDLREVWLGDNAAVDLVLKELKAEGEKGKAVALLRLKNRTLSSADAALGKRVNSSSAVEAYLKESLASDAYPANWSWVNQKDGRPPENGAPWLLDATPTPATDEALGKITGWSFELLRCQSASLALVGALSHAARTSQVSGPILLCEVSETRSFLVAISGQGVTGFTAIPVGFDNLAEATQGALGLKFRGSAARLMFNESYDFSEAAAKIVEPLAIGIRGGLPNLGALSPTFFVCSGVLARQTWLLQALSSALNLKPLAVDTSAWATAQGLILGPKISGEVASSWFGVLGAIAAFDPRNPGAALPWNPILSNTPAAPAPVIPAILQEPAALPPKPPAPAPAKPAEATVGLAAAAPAAAPPPKSEPAKIAPAPAVRPAEPVALVAKPGGVVITPPPKPLEPPKPVVPAPKTPPPPAKPVEPKVASKPEVKVATPSAVKPPSTKAEPAKPAPSAVAKPTLTPAPAPVTQKPLTTTPFKQKKSPMMMIVGIIVAVLVLGGGFALYSKGQKDKKEQEQRVEDEKARTATEAAARRLAEEKARQEADARKRAEEEAAQRQVLADQARLEAEEKARQAAALQVMNARGRLILNTDPAGATVSVGELTPRPSPVDMKDLRLGRYNVTIALPGYETESRDIDIKANEASDLGTIPLRRQIGSVEVSSDPTGLEYEMKPAGALFVNPADVRKGQTPAILADVPAGAYQVSVSRPGWPTYTTTVTVERNGSVKARGTFVGGTVVITSTPPGAAVMREQVQVGSTPLTLTDLQPADVTYTLTSRGLEPVTVSGHVEAGKTLTLAGTLLDSDRVMRPSELDDRPQPLTLVEPELTPTLRTEGGSATIEFVVGKDGTPSEMKVLSASNPAFGRVCLTATAKWKFKPGMVRGKPVRTRMTVPFRMNPES